VELNSLKPDGEAPLYIHQDAFIYAGTLQKGAELTQPIRHQAYVLVSQGQIMLDDVALQEGDGAEVTDTSKVTITALADAEILLIDTP
jgi:redox-sensitive bicupin YhaK (pirin superfamily)